MLEIVNVGFAVEHLLKKMKKSDVITICQINNFKREAQKFIRSMLTKLSDSSPLASLILKSVAIFDPAKLRELPKEKMHDRWKMLMKVFSNLGILILEQPPLNLKLFLMKNSKCFVQILMVFYKIVSD